jgi:site-specific DNA-cytosine methylase
MTNVELFSCAGGMAKGFRQAGIEFDFAFDFAADHCASYQANLGHKPVCIDVRDLLRLARAGMFGKPGSIGLFVADPPCTPWSRAGKRLGTGDERDMLADTCELISLLRPQAYLIGNVPGLDDGKNWHHVQDYIGGLSKYGYCTADFAALDAVFYGVPQRRVRPFWFGHLEGPCIQWPAPTHCDPSALRTLTLPGVDELKPWITCRQALEHLPESEIGRPVKLRKRGCNGKQHGSVNDRPARVVGTSNLSDGNVLLNAKHPPSDPDKPSATTVGAKMRGNGPSVMRTLAEGSKKHPNLSPDKPSTTIRGGGNGHSAPQLVLGELDVVTSIKTKQSSRDRATHEGGYRPSRLGEPAKTVLRNTHGDGSILTYDPQHGPSDVDKPAHVVRASSGGGATRTMRTRDKGRPGQGMRVGGPDTPNKTVTSKASRVGAGESHVIEWPWERPSTVVAADPRIAPPGHHDENWDGGTRSIEGAIVLSEKAATILQGFPENWHFEGKTKKARWSQIGQAMPPPLSYAVATSVAAQIRATRVAGRHDCDDDDCQRCHHYPTLATGNSAVV